jgi:hypothetical protein
MELTADAVEYHAEDVAAVGETPQPAAEGAPR